MKIPTGEPNPVGNHSRVRALVQISSGNNVSDGADLSLIRLQISYLSRMMNPSRVDFRANPSETVDECLSSCTH